MEIRPILSTLLRNKTGPLLVAIQVAVSLGILANALHIVQVRQAVVARPSGVAHEQSVFQMVVRNMASNEHNAQMATQKEQTAIVRALPGVQSVASTSMVPLSRNGHTRTVAAGRGRDAASQDAAFYVSGDSLVTTWELNLVEGRDFLPAEIPEVDYRVSRELSKATIVTHALAQKLWPGESTFVGKPLFLGTGDGADEMQVVGVVERLQTAGAELAPGSEYAIISPARVSRSASFSFLTVRTDPGQRDRVMKEAEQAIRDGASWRTLIRMTTMEEHRKDRYRADVALVWMLITVSALLLMVTASGIVGMSSLWVQQRTKQIGVRRALGARRVDILRYFLTENIMITACGVAAGVLLAIALNQLLVNELEMARLPVEYLLAGAGVLFVLGIGAVFGPAWRAASISPALATRSA